MITTRSRQARLAPFVFVIGACSADGAEGTQQNTATGSGSPSTTSALPPASPGLQPSNTGVTPASTSDAPAAVPTQAVAPAQPPTSAATTPTVTPAPTGQATVAPLNPQPDPAPTPSDVTPTGEPPAPGVEPVPVQPVAPETPGAVEPGAPEPEPTEVAPPAPTTPEATTPEPAPTTPEATTPEPEPPVPTPNTSACGGALVPNPFGCDFAFGTNGNEGNRSQYLDFITTWVGYEYTQGREQDCDGCGMVSELASTDAVAMYYAYFAGYALPDCNVQPEPPNLCSDGAQWLRDNREYYLGLYADYARKTYEASPNKGVVWLLEGDFIQYNDASQSQPLSMQELGELTSDIICAIKSNAPNAVVAMNHSTWNGDDETDAFWGAMPLSELDLIWTTGVGNNNGYIESSGSASSYNSRTATYAYLHALTGKPIWVDTSFGLSQAADSWTSVGADTINQRINEGVVGANVTEPPSDYESRINGMRGALQGVCQ